jgi:hypothetical protein
MNGRPTWSLSAWAAFMCVLFAVSSLMYGRLPATILLMFGALLIFGFAVLLDRGKH